jgi:predicted deacylase
VPICHLQAYQKDVRQIDENLNRVMTFHNNPITHEQKLANEIVPLIEQCDVLLDLHSTHCQGDMPFAFCDYPTKQNRALIDVLNVDYVLLGWPEIYAGKTDIADYSTERCAHDYQKVGITLECGYHKEIKATNVAYEAIINTLLHLDMIDGQIPQVSEKTDIRLTEYIVKLKKGHLCQDFKHLDKIIKGQKVAEYDDGEVLYALYDSYILLPNPSADVGSEWYYLGVKE